MIKNVVVVAVIMAAMAWARPSQKEAPLWEDCGTNPNRPLRVQFFNITPYPVEIPGKVMVSLRAVNKQDLGQLKLELNVERHIWGSYYMTIPCVQEQGSCTYEDLCGYLRDAPPHAEDIIRKVQALFGAAGTRLECPLKAKTMNVLNFEETLPEVPSFVSYVAAGKYRVTARFREPGTDMELGCFRLNIEAVAKELEADEDSKDSGTSDECWFWC